MKARHTPGDWRYRETLRTYVIESSIEFPRHRRRIAVIGKDIFKETECNARLIAAAPLLFSALQRIVRNGYLVDDVPDDVLNQALKALEQVEGDE